MDPSADTQRRLLPALTVLTVLCLLGAPFIGMHAIGLNDIWQDTVSSPEAKIFWGLRVPRVLAAFLAGAALSAGGLCFQALFRNPLATPYTLGVSSGAALGAALAMALGFDFGLGLGGCAFLGAAGAICLVYGLTRLRGGCSSGTMLLAGVAVSFSFSSLLLFLHYLSSVTDSFRIIRWLMGGVEVAGAESVWMLFAFALVGIGFMRMHVNQLNLVGIGEEFAASRGVNVSRTKLLLFLAVSLMVGGVVSICGPIGFVGMVCPHICRLLGGMNHRRLIYTAPLFGGIFLVLCDSFARVIIAPAEIPVGVVTALLGGPFFLWLLVRRNAALSL